jgi:MFS family permease
MSLTATAPARRPGERIDYANTLSPRTKALVLVGVMMGLFLAALDQTLVATALPRIVAELQGMDLFAWTSTSYLLASTTLVPIYGKLSDSFGRKVVMLAEGWRWVFFINLPLGALAVAFIVATRSPRSVRSRMMGMFSLMESPPSVGR